MCDIHRFSYVPSLMGFPALMVQILARWVSVLDVIMGLRRRGFL